MAATMTKINSIPLTIAAIFPTSKSSEFSNIALDFLPRGCSSGSVLTIEVLIGKPVLVGGGFFSIRKSIQT